MPGGATASATSAAPAAVIYDAPYSSKEALFVFHRGVETERIWYRWMRLEGTEWDWRTPQEGMQQALTYLGWSLHLLEDMTVPDHTVWQSAYESHGEYEDLVDELIVGGEFDHLPTAGWEEYLEKARELGIQSLAEYVAEETIAAYRTAYDEYPKPDTQGLYVWLAKCDVMEEQLDRAIKLTAAVIEMYSEDRLLDVVNNCPFALVARGTPLAKELYVLREFRDRYLLPNPIGGRLVRLYYDNSPVIARYLVRHDAARRTARAVLAPVVAVLKNLMPTYRQLVARPGPGSQQGNWGQARRSIRVVEPVECGR